MSKWILQEGLVTDETIYSAGDQLFSNTKASYLGDAYEQLSAIWSGHFMGRIMGVETWVRRTKYSLLYKSES
jgi:hypothetical protein